MVQVETHCHTRETSGCGRVPAKTVVREHWKSGYSTVIITDHYYAPLWERPDLAAASWDKKLDAFLKGYHTAKKEGDRIGVNVLLAAEIQFDGYKPYDFLIYGMEEAFLRENPYLNQMTPEAFYRLCKEKDFLMIHAHPYRHGKDPLWPVCYDGIEVYNGNPRHDSHNLLATRFARKHGLLLFSGTDYHMLEDCGRGGIMLPPEIDTIPKLIHHCREGGSMELIVTFEGKQERKDVIS